MQMYTDFYLCIHLSYGVPALHRANSSASSQQVLKQMLLPEFVKSQDSIF